jgi:ribosomal-protein-alanine N-acetyltransferase
MTIENLNYFNAIDLSTFDQKYFPYPWPEEEWKKIFFNEKDYHFKGLIQAHQLMGFILFLKNDLNEYWHLLKVAVHPDARRQGVAQQLLDSSLDQNRKIILEVATDNSAAIALYKKNKFEIIHTQKKFYSDGSDAHIMQRK